jgi:hypothetical protein
MIPLELVQEFLHDKKTQIYSPHSHWIEDYQVTSVTIRSDFGYDEWVFFCEYWDCGLLQSTKVTAPISQFNSWLSLRRDQMISELV